jgi:hypothetical protein
LVVAFDCLVVAFDCLYSAFGCLVVAFDCLVVAFDCLYSAYAVFTGFGGFMILFLEWTLCLGFATDAQIF